MLRGLLFDLILEYLQEMEYKMAPTIVLDKDVEGKMAEEKVKKVTKKGYLVKYGFNNDFVDLMDDDL